MPSPDFYVEYTDCISAENPGYDIKQSDGNDGALGKVEYLFITIDPGFTQTWSRNASVSYIWLK